MIRLISLLRNVIHEQFALMGFDATVVDRIPNAAKQARQATQELEFWWHPSASDPSLQIFTHCLDEYLYWTCVKAFGLPVSLPVEIYGVQKIAEEVVSHVKRKAAWVRTPLVLFPFGVDFAHFVASWDFGASPIGVLVYVQLCSQCAQLNSTL